MKKIWHKFKKYIPFIVARGIFLFTRIYVLNHPPLSYSDVSHDYERYANMWWYGLPPYLKHYYEYPPATVPLLWFPLWLDLHGFGIYYPNYRYQIFTLECLLFAFLLVYIAKLKVSKLTKTVSILFYCIAGMVAKDFWYEGLDVVFIGSLVTGIGLWYLYKQNLFASIGSWLFYWLSIAIKFMSGPIGLLFWVAKKESSVKSVLSSIIGFLIVWSVPLAIFRSSLSVSIVFHLERGAKYASFPAFIAETINLFTQSETRKPLPPDFEMVGPVSAIVETIFGYLFIGSVVFWCLWIGYRYIWRNRKLKDLGVFLAYTFVYILLVFLTGKVFSQPFHIWLVLLTAVFPYRNLKQQIYIMLLVVYMLILDTTPWIRVPQLTLWGPVTLDTVRAISRFVPMMLLLIWFWRYAYIKEKQNDKSTP